eukprot:NODE_866_length_3409_cov_0.418731.p2 type:complete len:313 gc:universal NODE_866_length_3409_cov_0.418731:3140-2202(-)
MLILNIFATLQSRLPMDSALFNKPFQFDDRKYSLIPEFNGYKKGCQTFIYKSEEEQKALKRVCSTLNHECLRGVQQEIHYLTTLKHENIVSGTYLGVSSKPHYNEMCYYFEMPFYNKDLFTIFDEFYSAPNRRENSLIFKFENVIKKMSRDILKALGYLHDKQVAHLDLKPENIVYSEKTDTYLLIDFDLSKSNTDARGPVGTPKYTSFEMYLRENVELESGGWKRDYLPYDPMKSDLFSFGALIAIYVMFLFTSVNYDFNADQQVDCEHSFFNQAHTPFTHEFMNFIARFIKCDPNKRMTAQQALEHSFLQ